MLALQNNSIDRDIQALESFEALLVLLVGSRMRQNSGLPNDRI